MSPEIAFYKVPVLLAGEGKKKKKGKSVLLMQKVIFLVPCGL
jgi:hypothetical protein